MQDSVSRSEAAHEAKRQRTGEEGAGGGGIPELPDEVLPTLLQSLELQARPFGGVGKAWRAAVRELGHVVVLVTGHFGGEEILRLRPLYPPGGVLVTEVASSDSHMLMVTDAGLLLGRGWNEHGQRGLEASVMDVDTLRPVPLQI